MNDIKPPGGASGAFYKHSELNPNDIAQDSRVFFDQVFGIMMPGLNHFDIEFWIEGEDDESFEQCSGLSSQEK